MNAVQNDDGCLKHAGHMSGGKGNEDLKLRGQVLIRDLDFKAYIYDAGMMKWNEKQSYQGPASCCF